MVLRVLGGFTAGWAAGGTPFATSVNHGLVEALNSVGQDLFGTAVFGALYPRNAFPSDPLRLDLGDNTRIPIVLNVFAPPD
jgi:hypothetical protein